MNERSATTPDGRGAANDDSAARPPDLTVALAWEGGFRFAVCGAAPGPVTLDGDSAAGLSPMEALLGALGACAATEIVDILRKGRQELRSLSLRLTGERRAEVPRRYVRIQAEVRIAGAV